MYAYSPRIARPSFAMQYIPVPRGGEYARGNTRDARFEPHYPRCKVSRPSPPPLRRNRDNFTRVTPARMDITRNWRRRATSGAFPFATFAALSVLLSRDHSQAPVEGAQRPFL